MHSKNIVSGVLRFTLFLRHVFCIWMRKIRTLLFLYEPSHQQRNNIRNIKLLKSFGNVLRCGACGEGEVNRCRTEGSNYQVTIIYLISVYPNIERREVTKLLDTNKNRKALH